MHRHAIVGLTAIFMVCTVPRLGAAGINPPQPGFQLPAPEAFPDLFVWTGVCNSYVLREGDAALVIDIGDAALMDHLDDIGVKSVEWVLLTHHHREQSQGMGRIDRTTTRVAAPLAEKELFENPTEFRKWFPRLDDRFTVHGASYVRPPKEAIPLDKGFEPGETFTWRGVDISCLGTPGHSPGGMTYLIRRDGMTAAVTGGLIHDGSQMTTWFDTEWDYGFAKGLDTLIATLDPLTDERPDLVLPSHGPAIHDALAQLGTYRDKLTRLRERYVRGYPVFEMDAHAADPISKPTAIPQINQVTPHLYKLNRQFQGKNFAIIIADSGKGLVLDCGLFPELMLHKMVHDMRRHLGLTEIDAMWISHMHGDHFLLGPALKANYGTEMWTLDRIAEKCEHPRRFDYAALVSSYSDGFDGMKIDRAFRDGETIEWEGYKIQVDWMPGQTEFGCCLWLEIDGMRVAFTGDNLFADAGDESQDGHEAVVARNSAIFEEGYLYGSRYLQDLAPDLVMGSHSYVMPDPAGLLERYHQWSKEIIALYKDLLPDKDYEYLFDPYWVSAYPYRVDLAAQDAQEVSVTVRNFRDSPQRHRVELKLPPGISAEPPVLEGTVPAEGRQSYPVRLHVEDRHALPADLHIVPFDITLDGKPYGELFDFLIRTRGSDGSADTPTQ
ncbi:hypothetical protein BH23VER1_BH23VER1_22370 [soil metagenome]